MPREYTTYDLSDYEITYDGQVINKHTGKKIKLQPNGKGYMRFGIHTDEGRRMVFVHRLVAEKYIPNPDNKPQVNHIDGNKLNNCADNLEWVTNKANREHAIKNGLHLCGEKCSWAKLNHEQVQYIRSHPEMKRHELAQMFDVSDHTISDIRTGKSWKNE